MSARNVVTGTGRYLVVIAALAVLSSPACAGQVVLSGMPTYQWWYGCAPTAGGMMVGYWDGKAGFGNLYDGDAGVWWGDGSQGTKSMVAGTAHITAGAENVYTHGDWHNSASYPNHESNPDSIADFCKTEDGGTSTGDIASGLKAYVEWDNPATAVNESYQATTAVGRVPSMLGDWTYDALKGEIDAGRPVILTAGTDLYKDGLWVHAGHAVVAYGYQDDMFNLKVKDSSQNEMDVTVGGFALKDTWTSGIDKSDWVGWSYETVQPVIDVDGVEWWPFVEESGFHWDGTPTEDGPWDWSILGSVTLDVIPEPATMCLLALGGLALLKRKRK
ncbi:MAG: C39 family peptidase [Planctomycetota bacterium]|nr:C39 family peptidase [Planctomycetota bacterium]